MSVDKSLTRQELARLVARKTGVTKRTALEMINSLESAIGSELVAGRSVTLTGFGTFYPGERKSRRGINPNTMESLEVPAMLVPKFRAGSGLKAKLRKAKP